MHRPLCRAKGSVGGLLPVDDSSYESCSEDSHSSLSRQTSGHGPLTRNTSMADSMVSSTLSSDLSSLSLDNEMRVKRHALSLGYDKTEVERAMAELGCEVTQESLLSWLVSNAIASCSSSIPDSSSSSPSLLRSIVIDGSNIALTHGRRVIFSCVGIRECVSFFEKRGHTDILVFLPAYRRETPRNHAPVSDHHILEELDGKGFVVWTPSRRIDGRRVVCHDDRYILRCAVEKESVIVSNDEFRELAKEDPSFRSVIEKRLLMYSFVDGRFMPPEDPLGRGGPTLDQFLSKAPPAKTQLCPYGRKCTYGQKCKYVHPERLKLAFVTDRQEKGQQHTVTTRVGSDSLSHRTHDNLMRTSSLDPSIRLGVKEEMKQVSAIPIHMKHTDLHRNKSAPLESPSLPPPSLFTPSHTIWGTPELCVSPISSPQSYRSERDRVFYHLSNVFPVSSVQTVMDSFPHENDARKLCESILQLHRGFESPVKSPNK